MVRALSLAVVGSRYPNQRGPTRLFELALCAPGEPVELVPEPDNPADENAIAVFSCRGVQIGYLTAERAPYIGGLLRGGLEAICIFQERKDYGAVIRAAFGGAMPVLPAKREQAPKLDAQDRDPDPDWYPDDEWPD